MRDGVDSGAARITLEPGDLIAWEAPELRHNVPGYMLVGPMPDVGRGEGLWFQFNPRPWHEYRIAGVQGLTVREAEEVLNGEREWPGPGRLLLVRKGRSHE
jgi:hypothetical protein